MTLDLRAWLKAAVMEPAVREAAVCLPGRQVWCMTRFREVHEASATAGSALWRGIDDYFAVMRLHSVRVNRIEWVMDSSRLVLCDVRGRATGGFLCEATLAPEVIDDLCREFYFAAGGSAGGRGAAPGSRVVA